MRSVDRRTDIWSFGCVLYELLAEQQAFRGETLSDVLARVLEREPDWDRLPTTISPAIRSLVKRCLRKDTRERLHDIADGAIEIEEALKAVSGEAESASDMVRRYRETPSPLVRDSVRGWRTGRLDRVFDGDFDVM